MQRPPSRSAFTLIEMITVIAIIAIISGLVLSLSGLVQNKGARAKTEAEIKAMSGACEAYKTDNGGYPQDTVTDSLDARTSVTPSGYRTTSLFFYKALSGDENANGRIDNTETARNYLPDFFRQSRFDPGYKTSGTISYVVDAFGNSYGYSTAGLLLEQEYRVALTTNASAPRPDKNSKQTQGYNPTFDLWSTGGGTTSSDKDKAKWLKNW